MLNACNYLVAFYGGDFYSESLTSKVILTVCGPCIKVFITKKQKFKVLLQSSVISIVQLFHFWDFFQWKDMEKI